jgi:hypothetical protein
MSISLPGQLSHSNPDFAIADIKDIRGGVRSIDVLDDISLSLFANEVGKFLNDHSIIIEKSTNRLFRLKSGSPLVKNNWELVSTIFNGLDIIRTNLGSYPDIDGLVNKINSLPTFVVEDNVIKMFNGLLQSATGSFIQKHLLISSDNTFGASGTQITYNNLELFYQQDLSVIGSVSKKEKSITTNTVLSGTKQSITLEGESGFYSFTNTRLQSISGIIGNSTIYAGKEITIQNYTGHDLIIMYDHRIGYIPFYTISRENIILRNSELVLFKISNDLNVALEVFRSYIDNQIYKTISANTVVDDSYHNSIAFVTSNCTITLPIYLRGDFVFNVRTFAGVTVTYVSDVNVTINAESNGNTQAEKSMVNICTYSSNNFLISGGKLSW